MRQSSGQAQVTHASCWPPKPGPGPALGSGGQADLGPDFPLSLSPLPFCSQPLCGFCMIQTDPSHSDFIWHWKAPLGRECCPSVFALWWRSVGSKSLRITSLFKKKKKSKKIPILQEKDRQTWEHYSPRFGILSSFLICFSETYIYSSPKRVSSSTQLWLPLLFSVAIFVHLYGDLSKSGAVLSFHLF